jgi:hypothetical protein
VLKQAILDIVEGPSQFECRQMSPEQAQQFRLATRVAAEEWVADEVNEPRRFVWVCEQLDMDPTAVRRQIETRRHS